MSEQLFHELRAARPVASAALRERVRSLSAEEPAREPFFARLGFLSWRRVVLVAPATMAVALVAAGVIGLTRGDVGGGADELAAVGASESAPPTATFDTQTKV